MGGASRQLVRREGIDLHSATSSHSHKCPPARPVILPSLRICQVASLITLIFSVVTSSFTTFFSPGFVSIVFSTILRRIVTYPILHPHSLISGRLQLGIAPSGDIACHEQQHHARLHTRH